ncbi:MAG: phosphoribosylanthranilate isomerase, partial [bacterium]|nr:phosphoribosylanthranilate isomerase [bacterium]
MVKIKICGITCAQDATWAANLGADFIGLNFFKDSPRKISPQNALEILKEIPPFVSSVGVFVNEDIKNIVKLVKKLSLSLVQLHGEETVEYCRQIKEAVPGIKIIKAFRIKDETVFDSMRPYLEIADYFLLDVYVEGIAGGTGATFNWDLALKAKELGKPIFLAGGLTPENVQEAVDKAKPFAADVASGIERSPKR